MWRLRRAIVCAAGVLLAAAAMPAATRAQGKLEARYEVTLAGLEIGTGSWMVDINDTHYLAAASGSTTGLLRIFTGGQGTSAARGTLNGSGVPLTSIYAATITTREKSDEIRLTINHGDVKDTRLEPPRDKDPERIPITSAHEHGIVDPMTASLLRAPPSGDMLVPETCQRTLAIFDGRLRYDLKLAYKRVEQVKTAKGYAGPALVCSVFFTPIAGFIPSRTAIKYIAKLKDMEVWFAPISGTRVLVPIRAEGPSPIGPVVLKATQFVSNPSPTRASAK
ncbi:MAG TPA: DUF3108 domain-containing protein [Pseudolabrys sp.]|nr:DUF3108 domain-containing protein [Pseudolabrys sp.]